MKRTKRRSRQSRVGCIQYCLLFFVAFGMLRGAAAQTQIRLLHAEAELVNVEPAIQISTGEAEEFSASPTGRYLLITAHEPVPQIDSLMAFLREEKFRSPEGEIFIYDEVTRRSQRVWSSKVAFPNCEITFASQQWLAGGKTALCTVGVRKGQEKDSECYLVVINAVRGTAGMYSLPQTLTDQSAGPMELWAAPREEFALITVYKTNPAEPGEPSTNREPILCYKLRPGGGFSYLYSSKKLGFDSSLPEGFRGWSEDGTEFYLSFLDDSFISPRVARQPLPAEEHWLAINLQSGVERKLAAAPPHLIHGPYDTALRATQPLPFEAQVVPADFTPADQAKSPDSPSEVPALYLQRRFGKGEDFRTFVAFQARRPLLASDGKAVVYHTPDGIFVAPLSRYPLKMWMSALTAMPKKENREAAYTATMESKLKIHADQLAAVLEAWRKDHNGSYPPPGSDLEAILVEPDRYLRTAGCLRDPLTGVRNVRYLYKGQRDGEGRLPLFRLESPVGNCTVYEGQPPVWGEAKTDERNPG